MNENVDICVRGGGVVGCVTALLLGRLNLRVALLKPTLKPKENATDFDIRAYALNAHSKSILESIHAWPEGDKTTAVKEMYVHSDQEGVIEFKSTDLYPAAELASSRNHSDAPALSWIVEVAALEERLDQALKRSNVIVSAETDPTYSHLYESDHKLIKTPLSVICEGYSSKLKKTLRTTTTSTPYYQHALATRVQVQDSHQSAAHQWFNQSTTANAKKDAALDQDGLEILALLPIGGAHSNTFAVVWSAAAEKIAKLKALTESEFAQALSSSSRESFKEFTVCGPRQTWPLALSSSSHWAGSFNSRASWVLCGDSAHTVHPLAGMGLNLGLGDAKSLYDFLLNRQSNTSWRPLWDLRVLDAYARERKLAILAPVTFIDLIQRLFASDFALARLIRNKGFKAFNGFSTLKKWTIEQAMQKPAKDTVHFGSTGSE